VDRSALADFVRVRREALTPAEVGLAGGPRRRTPGLRREEVAQLAGLSVDYVVRLEQARSSKPSDQVLGALSRALRLSDDEREHLHLLAGAHPPVRMRRSQHVRPGVLHLLDAVSDAGVFVVSSLGHLLAANSLAVELLGQEPGGLRREDSSIWRWFLDPAVRVRSLREDHGQLGRVWAAELRVATSRHPGDAEVEAMVGGLLERSPEFRAVWVRHEVDVPRSRVKRIIHPEHGLLTLDCENFEIPEGDQRLVVLTALPGTPEVDRLGLLRVVGRQRLSV
jgi:transcriptional regulator with XRE-family HTH domain